MDSATFIATFWARVVKGPDCWEWQGPRDTSGYGRHGHFRAHRVAYQLMVEPIPVGLVLDHLCRNPGCVNPDHLEPVTTRENTVVRGKPREKYDRTSPPEKLPCPDCGAPLKKVIDSRRGEDAIRRRRECVNGHRATTYEYVAARLDHLLGAA